MKKGRSSPSPQVMYESAASLADFQAWLHKVGDLAKSGDQNAIHSIWRAFNAITFPIGRLAKSNPSSVDLDLLLGVLRLCGYMLSCRLSLGDRSALKVAYALACESCELIEKARLHKSGFVIEMESLVSDWPTLRKGKPGARPAKLAKMLYEKAKLYRTLLKRHKNKKSIPFRDPLSRRAEESLLWEEAMEFKELLDVSEKFNADTWREWWKVGIKILKKYWSDDKSQRDKDWNELGPNNEGKTRGNYTTRKVQKAFKYLAAASTALSK
jgi:hypothetical protein